MIVFIIIYVMMTKKEYVLKVLEKVKWYRDKAETILQYISMHDDEGYIDYMYNKCVNAVDVAVHTKNEDKIKELWSILNNIHEKEIVSRKVDGDDIEKLDKLFESL